MLQIPEEFTILYKQTNDNEIDVECANDDKIQAIAKLSKKNVLFGVRKIIVDRSFNVYKSAADVVAGSSTIYPVPRRTILLFFSIIFSLCTCLGAAIYNLATSSKEHPPHVFSIFAILFIPAILIVTFVDMTCRGGIDQCDVFEFYFADDLNKIISTILCCHIWQRVYTLVYSYRYVIFVLFMFALTIELLL